MYAHNEGGVLDQPVTSCTVMLDSHVTRESKRDSMWKLFLSHPAQLMIHWQYDIMDYRYGVYRSLQKPRASWIVALVITYNDSELILFLARVFLSTESLIPVIVVLLQIATKNNMRGNVELYL